MDYERALEYLKDIATRDGWYDEIQMYEVRLLENLQDERLYGQTPQTQHDRWRIVEQLNRLCAQKHLPVSFNDLCRGKMPAPASSSPAPSRLAGTIGEVLCLYESSDESFYQHLKIALGHWERSRKISWLESRPGNAVISTQREHLRRANLILLLCSANFFAHPSCDEALTTALHEHEQRQVPVVPVLVSACAWEESRCAQMALLPSNKKPINEWEQAERAYEDIRHGLIRLFSPR
jgi:hypothetical protein